MEHAKNIVDGVSITVLLGTLLNYLPAVAAALTIIWTGIRIWEWIHNRETKD